MSENHTRGNAELDANWYVVHTYSGYENKVADSIVKIVDSHNMNDLVFDVQIPTEIVTEIKDNKKRDVERKIFPGYVLVKMIMTDDTWFTIRNIRGVTGFVGSSSTPVPLTEDEVLALGVEKRTVEVNYAVGDTVSIVNGPLEGFSGKVEEIDVEKNVVRVLLSMLGRETSVEFELDFVEPEE